MQRRRSRSIWLVPAVVAVFSACSREPGSAADAGVAGRYLVPRTAWGDPDLQGMWPIDKLNGTPVQRPESFGERRMLTEAEFAERVERLRGLNARYDQEIATNKMGIGHWAEMGEPNRLTSLIMEPANGRLPPLTAEGERRSATMTSSWSDIPFDQVVGLQRTRPLHHARHAGVDVPVHVQQRHRDHAGAGLRRHSARARA